MACGSTGSSSNCCHYLMCKHVHRLVAFVYLVVWLTLLFYRDSDDEVADEQCEPLSLVFRKYVATNLSSPLDQVDDILEQQGSQFLVNGACVGWSEATAYFDSFELANSYEVALESMLERLERDERSNISTLRFCLSSDLAYDTFLVLQTTSLFFLLVVIVTMMYSFCQQDASDRTSREDCWFESTLERLKNFLLRKCFAKEEDDNFAEEDPQCGVEDKKKFRCWILDRLICKCRCRKQSEDFDDLEVPVDRRAKAEFRFELSFKHSTLRTNPKWEYKREPEEKESDNQSRNKKQRLMMAGLLALIGVGFVLLGLFFSLRVLPELTLNFKEEQKEALSQCTVLTRMLPEPSDETTFRVAGRCIEWADIKEIYEKMSSIRDILDQVDRIREAAGVGKSLRRALETCKELSAKQGEDGAPQKVQGVDFVDVLPPVAIFVIFVTTFTLPSHKPRDDDRSEPDEPPPGCGEGWFRPPGRCLRGPGGCIGGGGGGGGDDHEPQSQPEPERRSTPQPQPKPERRSTPQPEPKRESQPPTPPPTSPPTPPPTPPPTQPTPPPTPPPPTPPPTLPPTPALPTPPPPTLPPTTPPKSRKKSIFHRYIPPAGITKWSTRTLPQSYLHSSKK